ncbi:nucleoid-associated protein [Pseudomonas chlororaphis]|uniref:nucleoid-associated protein n=1 Tax=Pseudomonas chlororaphis TaxID=587753 RepID=UPI0039E6977B
MSDIKINFAVIHELVKTQHKDIQPSIIRKLPLDPNNTTVNKVVNEVTSVYGRKQNSAHYGVFSNSKDRGLFPESFHKYAVLQSTTSDDFMTISRAVMENLFEKAEKITPASGGYLLFSDYEVSGNRFFMIAMIKSREGFRLSANLEPEELLELDLTKLNQAARINIKKYHSHRTIPLPERQEINYLSFVSPSSTQSAAGYFVTALGCAKGTASALATKTLIKESSVFFANTPQISKFKSQFREDLIEYLNKKKPGDSIRLSEIENLARKYIPSEIKDQADKIAEEFIEYLNGDEHAIPVEFPISHSTLQKFTHVSYKDESLQIKFEKLSFSDDPNASIYFDQKSKKLTFNKLPQALEELLESELAQQKSEKSAIKK